jgi:hypothetical protein
MRSKARQESHELRDLFRLEYLQLQGAVDQRSCVALARKATKGNKREEARTGEEGKLWYLSR